MKERYCYLNQANKVLRRFSKLSEALAEKGGDTVHFLARDDGTEGIVPIFKWDRVHSNWCDLFPDEAGGPRAAAGRPLGVRNKKGARKEKWVKFSSIMPADLYLWLDDMKKKGHSKNKLIADGLRFLQKQLLENIK